jgi:enoyl-CoA hydratase/carnithine racemase
MPDSPVTTRYESAVAIVVVDNPVGDNPAARNSLDATTRVAFADAVAQANGNDVTRVVVVSGAKGCFATGVEPYLGEGSVIGAASTIAAATKPTIAWIDGDCHDMGLELALACDIRVCSRRATFAMRQVQQGMLPWDGGTQRLARLVGRGQALRMLLTGEEIDADEAMRVGLVQLIGGFDDMKTLANKIAAGAPIAARYAKEAAISGADLSLDQGLRLEADLSVLLQSTDDRAEGLRSFVERSDPEHFGPEFKGE